MPWDEVELGLAFSVIRFLNRTDDPRKAFLDKKIRKLTRGLSSAVRYASTHSAHATPRELLLKHVWCEARKNHPKVVE